MFFFYSLIESRGGEFKINWMPSQICLYKLTLKQLLSCFFTKRSVLFCRLIEIPFGEKDQRGECTLLQGDTVEFQIATDRRDKLQRATNIALMEETFDYSGDIRETVNT